MIEVSGAVRWTRCLPTIAYPRVAPSADGPAVAAVFTPEPAGLQAFDLAAGADVAVPDAAGVTQPGWFELAASERYLLLGPDAAAAATTGFVLFDLVTLAVTAVPGPPAADPAIIPTYTVTNDGVVSQDLQRQTSAAVYVDDAWQTDPAIIDASLPLVITSDFEAESPTMLAFTPAGSVAWELPTVFDHHLESFRSAIDGNVALVAGVPRSSSSTVSTEPMYCSASMPRAAPNSGDFPGSDRCERSATHNDGAVVLTGDDIGVRLYVPLGMGLPTTTLTL